MLTRSFDSCASLFHTVFNRIVENCHEAFILRTRRPQKMARELLAAAAPPWRDTCANESGRFTISHPRRDNISSCLDLPADPNEAGDPQCG